MLTRRFDQSQEQTIHVVGGPILAPVSAPDTLQLYVTDARRVHTHINTLRQGIKSPYLTLGFPPPHPLSSPPFVLWVYVTRCGPTTNLIKMLRCNCVCVCDIRCLSVTANAACLYETM